MKKGRFLEGDRKMFLHLEIGNIPITANQQTAGLEEKQRRMLGKLFRETGLGEGGFRAS